MKKKNVTSVLLKASSFFQYIYSHLLYSIRNFKKKITSYVLNSPKNLYSDENKWHKLYFVHTKCKNIVS